MMTLTVSNWAKVSYWTIEEAVQLCFGMEPVNHPEPEDDFCYSGLPEAVPREVKDLYALIERSVLLAEIKYTEVTDESGQPTYGVRPIDFVNWCETQDLPFFANLADGVQMAENSVARRINHKLVDELEISSTVSKNRGGRPLEYDWDSFFIEIIRIANSPDGLPDKQVDLVKTMLQWFSDKFGGEPAESSVKSRISKIYKHLDKGKNFTA